MNEMLEDLGLKIFIPFFVLFVRTVACFLDRVEGVATSAPSFMYMTLFLTGVSRCLGEEGGGGGGGKSEDVVSCCCGCCF